jgi:hypothetical protein
MNLNTANEIKYIYYISCCTVHLKLSFLCVLHSCEFLLLFSEEFRMQHSVETVVTVTDIKESVSQDLKFRFFPSFHVPQPLNSTFSSLQMF